MWALYYTKYAHKLASLDAYVTISPLSTPNMSASSILSYLVLQAGYADLAISDNPRIGYPQSVDDKLGS